MTIRDLIKEVEALGFFATLELDDSLVSQANRALRMIHTHHPKRKRGEIVFLPKDAIVTYAPMAGEGSEVSLSVPAGRLTMKIRGEGKYVVKINDIQKTYRFFSEANSLEIDFHEAGEITFSSDSVFCAWDIALFPNMAHPYYDAISFCGNGISFDLRKIFPDLLYLIEMPKNADGKSINKISIEDSCHLLVPIDYRGVISLLYSAKAKEISIDSEENDAVDISEELTPLLPLLISYFLWIEEHPDMAELYLSEYEKLSRAIKQRETPLAVEYIDVNHWS